MQHRAHGSAVRPVRTATTAATPEVHAAGAMSRSRAALFALRISSLSEDTVFGTLILLAGPTLGFRLLGLLGVRRFASWRTSAAHGLAVMLVATATAHFAPGAWA